MTLKNVKQNATSESWQMIKIVHDRKSLLKQHYLCICYGNFPVIFLGFPLCFCCYYTSFFFFFFPQWHVSLRCKKKIITAIFQLYSAQYHLKCVIHHLVIHLNKKSHNMQRQKIIQNGEVPLGQNHIHMPTLGKIKKNKK